MKKLLLLSMSILSLSSFSAEIKLVDITSNNDDELTVLIIETDGSNKLQAMRKEVFNRHGKFLSSDSYTPNEVMSKGAVVSESSGRDVVVIKSQSGFNINNGGNVKLDYLYNGITGERKSKSVQIIKSGSTWKLVAAGKNISKMHFLVNKKPIIGTVGIKEIQLK